MTTYYQRQDLRHYVCTDPETTYGVATAQARHEGAAGREFMLARDVIAESIKRTGYNLCGGEFNSMATDEQKDATAPISMFATPDATGWMLRQIFGGTGGYSVTGSGDPYTHENRPIQSPDYRPDSFSIVEGWKGGTEFYQYRGGLISTARIRGSIDGDKRIQIEATAEFAGERTLLAGFDPPSCVGEEVYRMPDAVLTFSTLTINAAGAVTATSAVTGLTMRSFEFSFDNKLETLDEAQRTGQYVTGRDRGDRTGAYRCRLSILGKKGDSVDTAFHAGTFVRVAIQIPNKTANRVWNITLLSGQIMSKSAGFSTSVGKTTHDFDIEGFRDRTSDTTQAQSPIYSTIQTSTASYETVAP